MLRSDYTKIIYTLLPLAARTTSSTSSSQTLPPRCKGLVFLLNVTNADTDANDTLDVYIQESPDGGTTWNDIAHFAQILGTTAATLCGTKAFATSVSV